jgi:hypothetical protein
LGYYDDGEERLGDEDGDLHDSMMDKKRKGAMNNLSAAALKGTQTASRRGRQGCRRRRRNAAAQLHVEFRPTRGHHDNAQIERHRATVTALHLESLLD